MAGSGEGGERAVAGSGEGGERPLLHSLEYPCTRRLRRRRLLACIRMHSHVDVYLTARQKTYVIFKVKYLAKMVREGQWRDASYYLGGFSGYDSSYVGRLLNVFLQDLVAFEAFADGRIRVIGYLCDWLMSIHKKPVLDKYPCFATVVTDVLFMRKDHASAFLDWQLVRKKAAKMVEEMAYKAPELRDRMQYPRSRNSLYHFMPIGSKRRVKHVNRMQLSTDLAQFYLQMKQRLASLSPGADHSYSESARVRGEPLIALFDTCFEAGRLLGLEQGQFPEVMSNEDCPYFQARGFRVISSKRAKPSSKPHTSQRPAVVGSSVTNSGTKSSRCFQESQLDTLHPGNDPKRPRTAGDFGDN